MQELADKVAFVTGGASGIGLAMVRAFNGAGMKVVAADVEQAALDAVRAEFGQAAGVLAIRVDVTDRAAMEKAAQAAEDAFGTVHVLCNNAGVAVDGTIDKLNYADWDWVLGVNLQGVINGVQTFVPRMLAHGEGGHVVNTASMAGLFANPSLSVYTASKFAVVGLSESMRLDLADRGIGVSVLCPGVVNTNIGDCARNRPASLAVSAKPATAEPTAKDQLTSELAGDLDPSVVGDMVLHAVQQSEFYIFTHPAFQAVTDARNDEIVSAMSRWRDYRRQRNIA